ncbi:MAG: hypothetical protein MZV63_14250 [Marinilabiliales bacterium]|nr:hypothetical protein [Marinilabiliales bacterium]
MKIAISIPDSVFREVKRAGRRAETLPERGHRRGRQPVPERPRNPPDDRHSERSLLRLLKRKRKGPRRAADLELYVRTVLAKEKDEW